MFGFPHLHSSSAQAWCRLENQVSSHSFFLRSLLRLLRLCQPRDERWRRRQYRSWSHLSTSATTSWRTCQVLEGCLATVQEQCRTTEPGETRRIKVDMISSRFRITHPEHQITQLSIESLAYTESSHA